MYKADSNRYDKMPYRNSGDSGLKLPGVALGLWHNFGGSADYDVMRETVTTAFDMGVTYLDVADNYGPPAGSAETNLGKIVRNELKAYRDELVISTKAGFDMWEGPYGNWGSRKHLMSGIDNSLKRLGLEYVDIFYHHRPDPNTPIEETMGALTDIVASGKALYAAISNYSPAETERAVAAAAAYGRKLITNQVCCSMLNRSIIEAGLPETCQRLGIGITVYSPLAQGMLTDRAAQGMIKGTRVEKSKRMNEVYSEPETQAAISGYYNEAKKQGLTLSQYAIKFCLDIPAVSTVIIGAKNAEQVKENLGLFYKQ